MSDINTEIKQYNTDSKYEEIKKFLVDFLEKLTVQFENIEITQEEPHQILLITTNDSGILIGNNGESLRALNHIIKRISEKKFPNNDLRFLLDVNEYHSKKISLLKNKAKMLAERARAFKSNIEMEPINAYERMIVHSLFIDDPEISTESEGQGKTRRVMFKYSKNDKQSENNI